MISLWVGFARIPFSFNLMQTSQPSAISTKKEEHDVNNTDLIQ